MTHLHSMSTIARNDCLSANVDTVKIPIASLKALELALATDLISRNTAFWNFLCYSIDLGGSHFWKQETSLNLDECAEFRQLPRGPETSAMTLQIQH